MAKRLEGRAALVIDQHKVDDARVVAQRHAGNQGHQQFGFARAGGAGDHAMHAIATLFGRENQMAHIAHADHANRHAQPFGVLGQHAVGPRVTDADLVDRVDLALGHDRLHLQHIDRTWQVAAKRAWQFQAPNLGGKLFTGAGGIQPVGLAQEARAVQADLGVTEDGLLADGRDFDHGLALAGDLRGIISQENNRCAEGGAAGINRSDNRLSGDILERRGLGGFAEQIDHDQQHRQRDVGLVLVILGLAQPHLSLVQLFLDALPERAGTVFLVREAQLLVLLGLVGVDVVIADAAHDTVRHPLAPLPALLGVRVADHIQTGVLCRMKRREVGQHTTGKIQRIRSVFAKEADAMLGTGVAGLGLTRVGVAIAAAAFGTCTAPVGIGVVDRARAQGDRNWGVAEDGRVGGQLHAVFAQQFFFKRVGTLAHLIDHS